MSSLTDMSTLTASSQVTTPLTQMSATLRPLETSTSLSTIHPGHHTPPKPSGCTVTGSWPSRPLKKLSSSHALTEQRNLTATESSSLVSFLPSAATAICTSTSSTLTMPLDCMSHKPMTSPSCHTISSEILSHTTSSSEELQMPTTSGGSKCSKPNSSSDKVCKWWNLGCCMSDSCKYKHSCAICGQPHQAKSCGGYKSG